MANYVLLLVRSWLAETAEPVGQTIAQSLNIEKWLVMTNKHQQNLIGVDWS